MSEFPEIGKIEEEFFQQRIFPYMGENRDEVVEGPGFGVDCAVIELPNGMAMGLTSDPVSFIPPIGLRESAWLSVILAANDMATTGYRPMFAQFVLNMPESVQGSDFEKYWSCINEFCTQMDIAITGGHTGRCKGVYSTIAGGVTLINYGKKKDYLTTRGAQTGDDIILIGSCALSSTSILAKTFPKKIRHECGEEIQQSAAAQFFEISTVEASIHAAEFGRKYGGVTSIHDITEGGVLGGIYELCEASNTGVELQRDKIRLDEPQRSICELFKIDPYISIGSGAAVITCNSEMSENLVKDLEKSGHAAVVCGRLTDIKAGRTIIEPGDKKIALIHPDVDPYWAAFHKAMNDGWQ